MNKCQRCGRTIVCGKTVDVSPVDSLKCNKTLPNPISKESFYGNRRNRAQPHARQNRPRFEEPQCFTLSSDEEEPTNASPEPEAKKLKEDSPEPSTHTDNAVQVEYL